jgi:23S rRNA (guanosine2251-2'-O)-methyltransferase
MKQPPDPRQYRARKCTEASCGLRFPVPEASELGRCCPRCGSPTEAVDGPYPTRGVRESGRPADTMLQVLIDNVRSLRNVGSMFRTADGAGVDHVYLGGITPTPDHPKLAKTALGAQSSVSWTHHPDAAVLAAELATSGHHLWAVEGGPGSVSSFDPELRLPIDRPLVVVVGHEVSGIDPRILGVCERVVHIPMLGIKTSLNVSVALGIVLYALRFAVPVDTTDSRTRDATDDGKRPSSANHR